MTEITSRLSTALADRYKLDRHMIERSQAASMSVRDFCIAGAAAVILAGVPREAAAQRPVEGTTISSDTLPAVRIELDASLNYVGTQTIMLGPTTRAEQHFFVESEGGRIVRLYWLQFEGKVGGRGRPFNYSRDPTIDFGGTFFHVNYRFFPTSGFSGSPGSDGDAAQQLLEREGYRLGTDLMRVRLVWLLGDPPLDELMIIYLEDLSDHDLTVAELERDPARWRTESAVLQRRALAGMRLIVP